MTHRQPATLPPIWRVPDGLWALVQPVVDALDPPRRWVAERTLAWLSKCRALLVRYDKRASNFLGLIQLACALL